MHSENTSRQTGAPWCIAAALRTELFPVKTLYLPNAQLICTGVGLQNAERVMRNWLSAHAPELVLHIGFAGALSPDLAVGDILVGEFVRGPYEAGGDAFLLDKTRALQLEGVSLHFGAVVSVDRILATAAEKVALAAEWSAGQTACVDMESAAVARVCAEHRTRYLGIRAITDARDDELPVDFNECRGHDGNIETMRVMWAAAHRPGSIAGLLEMRRRARNCAQQLAIAVRGLFDACHTPA